MIFPLEVVKLKNKVDELKLKEDYQAIYKLRHEIIDLLDQVKEIHPEILDDLVMSTYYIGDIDRTIMLGDEFAKIGHESFIQVYFMLLAFFASCDIYRAVSLVKRSKILNEGEIKLYLTKEEVSFSSLIRFDTEVDKCLAITLASLTLEISKEMIIIEVIDKSYLFYRLFDCINLLNELGFSREVVLKLSDDIRNVFMSEALSDL